MHNHIEAETDQYYLAYQGSDNYIVGSIDAGQHLHTGLEVLLVKDTKQEIIDEAAALNLTITESDFEDEEFNPLDYPEYAWLEEPLLDEPPERDETDDG